MVVLLDLVESDQFSLASLGLVLVNVAVMCAPYSGMPTWYSDAIENASAVITWLLVLEMGLKLAVLGWRGYWSVNWNVLDGTVVIISMVEFVLARLAGEWLNISFLRLLRMLRVLRMLRLMKSWKGLYKIILALVEALPQMSNVLILMVIAVVIFALLGKEMFGGQLSDTPLHKLRRHADEGPIPPPETRYHFDSFVPAMLTTFIILTGKWHDPLVAAVDKVGAWAVGYFVAVVLVGTYLIVNLFVAVLLQVFALQMAHDHASELDHDLEQEKWVEMQKQLKLAKSGVRRASVSPARRRASTVAGRSSSTAAMMRRGVSQAALLALQQEPWPRNYSLLMFGKHHPFRKACKQACIHAVRTPELWKTSGRPVVLARLVPCTHSRLSDARTPTSAARGGQDVRLNHAAPHPRLGARAHRRRAAHPG